MRVTTSLDEVAADGHEESRYEGFAETALAIRFALPRVIVRQRVASTMDEGHRVARAGALAGTLIIAEQQDRGRGRAGRAWASPAHAGIWITLVERPEDPRALAVLSLRLGLAAAAALDTFASSNVRLKWPNDLMVRDGKVGGILVEARWRDTSVEWVALGIGINVRPAGVDGSAHLRDGVSRLEVLDALIPPLRRAASVSGELSAPELTHYERRDMARGCSCLAPVAGRVLGIAANGALRVETTPGRVTECREGSLVLEAAT